jgi:hypothetical protein
MRPVTEIVSTGPVRASSVAWALATAVGSGELALACRLVRTLMGSETSSRTRSIRGTRVSTVGTVSRPVGR